MATFVGPAEVDIQDGLGSNRVTLAPTRVFINNLVGPYILVGAAAQSSSPDSEETISEFSNNEEVFSMSRCKKKLGKKHGSVALANPKCVQFVKAVHEGKGIQRRKGGRGVGSMNGKARLKEEVEVMAQGGFFFC